MGYNALNTNEKGHLTIGGVDVLTLAEEFGTPCYIMDENEIRRNCSEFYSSMRKYYNADFKILYASKALSCHYLYKICKEENLGADVVSGGELFSALRAGISDIYFHGNNKTKEELTYAVENNIECIVVDNRDELELLCEVAKSLGKTQKIGLRLTPGIEAHTHEFVKTGGFDSKFGTIISNGDALKLVGDVLKMNSVKLKTLHCHIGSQIFDTQGFVRAAEIMVEFIAKIKETYSWEIEELNLGGGFGITYEKTDDPRPIEEMVKLTATSVQNSAKKFDIKLPKLLLEPGRKIVGEAGITVYKIGSIKDLPNGNRYISVDGGMADNIRFAMYDSKYQFVIPKNATKDFSQIVSIAGRHCESGDFLGKNVELQQCEVGDILAVLATGAYNYSMANHYNRIPKPPIVVVKDGKPFVAVKRETWQDVASMDVL